MNLSAKTTANQGHNNKDNEWGSHGATLGRKQGERKLTEGLRLAGEWRPALAGKQAVTFIMLLRKFSVESYESRWHNPFQSSNPKFPFAEKPKWAGQPCFGFFFLHSFPQPSAYADENTPR